MPHVFLESRPQDLLQAIFKNGIFRIAADLRLRYPDTMQLMDSPHRRPPQIRKRRSENDELTLIHCIQCRDLLCYIAAEGGIDFFYHKGKFRQFYAFQHPFHLAARRSRHKRPAFCVEHQGNIARALFSIEQDLDRNPIAFQLHARIIGSREIIRHNQEPLLHRSHLFCPCAIRTA